MQDSDAQEFATLMAGVAENFGATVSSAGMALRFQALREFDMAQVRAAANSILRSRKYTTMPTIAEFLEYLGGGRVDDIAALEASKVFQAVRSIGAYRSVAFDDPVTQAVVQQGFGGWVKLCEELTEENEKWLTKDFLRLYGAFSRQGVKAVGYLCGRTELANQALGRKGEVRVALVGDRQKALAIAQTPSEDEGTRRGIGGAGEALGRILGALEARAIKPAA